MYDNIISSFERCALKSCNKKLKSCNKKLKLVNNYESECGNYYCIKHKFSMDHDCTFDYKKKQQEILQKNLQKIEFRKISII